MGNHYLECLKQTVVQHFLLFAWQSLDSRLLNSCTKYPKIFQKATSPHKHPAVHFHSLQLILSSAGCTQTHWCCCCCCVVSAAFHHQASSWVCQTGWGPSPPSRCLGPASAPAYSTAPHWPSADRESPARPRVPCRLRWCCLPSPPCWAGGRSPAPCALA